MKKLLLTLMVMSLTLPQAFAQMTDTDGDGISDSADLDNDNDGILDTDEIAYCDQAGDANITGGSGTTYRNQLYFFDWAGVGQTITDGTSVSKTLSNGVTRLCQNRSLIMTAMNLIW